MIETIKEICRIIFTFDGPVFTALFISLKLSLISTFISFLLSTVLSFILLKYEFVGKNKVLKLVRMMNALPPVVSGVFVYMLFRNSGLLGSFNILFSLEAMIVAQVILITPIMTHTIYHNTVPIKDLIIYESTLFNDTKQQQFILLIKEIKHFLILAIVLGFSRSLSEVGAVTIVGGNISNKTRTLTTYVVLQANMGNFEQALAAGIILLVLSYIIFLIVDKFYKEKTYVRNQ